MENKPKPSRKSSNFISSPKRGSFAIVPLESNFDKYSTIKISNWNESQNPVNGKDANKMNIF